MNYLLIINLEGISVKVSYGIHLIISFIRDENVCTDKIAELFIFTQRVTISLNICYFRTQHICMS